MVATGARAINMGQPLSDQSLKRSCEIYSHFIIHRANTVTTIGLQQVKRTL